MVFQTMRPGKKKIPNLKAFFAELEEALFAFQEHGDINALSNLVRLLKPYRDDLGEGLLLNSKPAWRMLENLYERLLPEGPFLDFFWTWRFLVGNLFSLLLADIPPAKLYHTVSTGYAGLFSARAHLETGRPAVVSEHGIYTNERRIEISMADWLYETPRAGFNVDTVTKDIRSLWVNAFQAYSLCCYEACAQIITLFGGNQKFQIADGANPERMRVIPNGIGWRNFDNITRAEGEPPTLALIGRVVPIKDIKTFLRACATVKEQVPDLRVLIMGPTDEDKEYFKECEQLISHLALFDTVEFTGRVRLTEYMNKVDVMVLTSISEGQPLVILEAGAAGVPSVTTDVGACREMIEGMPDEDPPLGMGGAVTAVANPAAIAQACIKLLRDPIWRKQCGEAIRQRVRAYYDLDQMKAAYDALYEELSAMPDAITAHHGQPQGGAPQSEEAA
ncbi:putative group 1 glycosyl transferase [Magnetofaba australis IT-1]|uniref:Putative group 1 glycosyl transferase n=2 Tax=Magnetofaba TaxID=1472292 RepID=A0A1Y2K6J4_9PROT|nr:putative group 1 glycosyl transferase [Magnetofaba australis IT-1]